MEKQNSDIQQGESIYVDNVGIVLIAPYFPRLFSMLSFMDGYRKFKGETEQLKAIAAMHYAATGKGCVQNQQDEICKILTGVEVSKQIPQLPELTKEEKDVCESMLKGVLQNWPKLRNSSIQTLQEAFLIRPGKIEIKEDHINLTVEEKAYDILLDSLPWNFRSIKFPWIEKWIEVKWR